MKFWKINEKALRCVLKLEELKEQDIRLEDVLGMLLLCIGIGSLLTMPLSGAAAVRLGCRRVLTAAGLVYGALLLALCTVSSFHLAVPLLLIFGATMGCIDVVVNIQAVISRKRRGDAS